MRACLTPSGAPKKCTCYLVLAARRQIRLCAFVARHCNAELVVRGRVVLLLLRISMRRVDFFSRDRYLVAAAEIHALVGRDRRALRSGSLSGSCKAGSTPQCMVKDGEVNFTSRDGSHGSSYPRSLEWRRKGKRSHSDE